MPGVRSVIDMSAPALGPVRAPKNNHTFSDDKLVDISRGNHLLMDRLSRVKSSLAPVVVVKRPAEASASINRRKQASKIQADNEVPQCGSAAYLHDLCRK